MFISPLVVFPCFYFYIFTSCDTILVFQISETPLTLNDGSHNYWLFPGHNKMRLTFNIKWRHPIAGRGWWRSNQKKLQTLSGTFIQVCKKILIGIVNKDKDEWVLMTDFIQYIFIECFMKRWKPSNCNAQFFCWSKLVSKYFPPLSLKQIGFERMNTAKRKTLKITSKSPQLGKNASK